MKSISIIAPALLLSCSAFAVDNLSVAAAPEKAFRDPFAATNAPSKWEVSDPLEPVNRTFFHFNDHLYRWFLRPVAKGYRTVAPKPFRVCVERVFTNLEYPVRLVNNVLEGRFQNAGIETARFVVNSTVGVAGIFDPASHWKLSARPADFDQTLAVYRIPSGMFLNWPIFGPSSVRGTAGMVGDSALNPLWYVDVPIAMSAGAVSLKTVNGTSLHSDEYDELMRATFDPYVAVRSAYFESRRKSTKD